ncbi:16S rRNA (uracil(1498)-N(3))-methyltransferase [Virgibacillus phasianinus]|uniref:Ribosomal RNA small subunit methyltransferase E n=1 Tax=Virgibacillus phasianinus TaxID=2017483 RepID=A0A220U4Q9_9BACI|nr:16S rRNA (uracil(1498)-N(3))-methyltransferase [Virgibacillus phasianinus]ASK63148.1 16S rRNA (uracil(1498)-N(3))-methyltransferase [Virgibacillus phasianinus]
MQRYFVPEDNWQDDRLTITGDDAHHIIRVMRGEIGDELICNHPSGFAVLGEVMALEQQEVAVFIKSKLEEKVELPVYVTIAHGLPKGDKLEYVLQKGTELGASAFIPFKADRSIVKWDGKKASKKMARFAKIVKEASEQSHRNRIPQVSSIMGIEELIAETMDYDVKIFAYEEEAKTDQFVSFSKIVSKLRMNQQIVVCIGPEGGFSDKEVTLLKKNDFHSVRLGPRILRTETAPLYVLASISYQLEELGC